MKIQGDSNICNSDNATIEGDANIVNGDKCVVHGDANIINGNHCKVYGDCTIINGDYCSYDGDCVILNGRYYKNIGNKKSKKGKPTVTRGYSWTDGNSVFNFNGNRGNAVMGTNYTMNTTTKNGKMKVNLRGKGQNFVNSRVVNDFTSGGLVTQVFNNDGMTTYTTSNSSPHIIEDDEDEALKKALKNSTDEENDFSVPKEEEEKSAPEDEKENNLCSICKDRIVCTMIKDCNHACLCVTCARQILLSDDEQQMKCPVCRKKIEKGITKFYK